MTNVFNSHKLYKLIVLIFLLCAFVKIKSQIVTLNNYNREIATLNDKIAVLESDIAEKKSEDINSKEDNEDIARKTLKMYYSNETPYKGY